MKSLVLNTSEMFIHSLSQWSLVFTNVVEATLRAIDKINQITDFTSNLTFWWKVLHMNVLRLKKLVTESIFFLFLNNMCICPVWCKLGL